MKGRYQAYKDYRSSEASWCGNVPTHWQDVKFKWILEEKKKTSNTSLKAGSISFGKVVYKDEEKLAPETKASYQEVLKGELLINPLNLNFDLKSLRTALSALDVVVSTGYIVAYISKGINHNYMRWVMHQFDVSHMKTMGSGVRQTINYTDIANSMVCIAPTPEQQKIANFLDHETAKIDTLITKQEKLIELLKEKRQAVISHAVTKGLNPQAPMKDSGVEWLGEVPEHWKVAALKHLVSAPIIDGPHVSPTRCDTGIPFISAEAISNGKINFDKKWGYISEAANAQYSKRYSPQINDLLIVKLGATTGAIAIVETDKPFNIWVPLATVRTVADLDSKFVYYLFQSSQIADAIQQSWTFGTQQTLGLGTLSNLRIPVPPTDECKQIVKEIESKVVQFDEVIKRSTVSLELLKERKTALISAAVTGKIDVRDFTLKNGEAN